MNEDRIMNALEALQCQTTSIQVSVARLEEQIKVAPDHETRIRTLEHWRWGYTGLLAVATTFITAWTTVGGGKA